MDSSNADGALFRESSARMNKALNDVARERDEALTALAESRARFADSEARRAELEAVIEKVRAEATELFGPAGESFQTDTAGEVARSLGAPLHALLDAVPSVVLEDRDREVAARTLEKYADSRWSPSAYYLRSCAAAIRAGGDTFPEQHVRGLYSDELQTMVDELREAHRIAKDWSRRNEDASEVASYVRNALDVLEVELAEWPRAAAIPKGAPHV